MVAGSVTKVSVGWSAPSSSMTTSRPASRRRAAAVAPPAPVPTTTASAAYSRAPSSAPPAITFGYAIRCSGGASRSAGALMKKLRAAEHQCVGTAGPVDAERGEDLGVLVEGQEDERAEALQERAPEPAGMLEGGEVAGGLPRRHRREPTPAPCEEGRPELDQPETERQAEAERPGQVREETLDVAEHVVVDRLVEAMAARPDGGDHRAQDARRGEHPEGTLGKAGAACNLWTHDGRDGDLRTRGTHRASAAQPARQAKRPDAADVGRAARAGSDAARRARSPLPGRPRRGPRLLLGHRPGGDHGPGRPRGGGAGGARRWRGPPGRHDPPGPGGVQLARGRALREHRRGAWLRTRRRAPAGTRVRPPHRGAHHAARRARVPLRAPARPGRHGVAAAAGR